jgi:ABC-type multidrug transport system permease subunit
MAVATELRTVAALFRRALNELFRVPGAAIPGILSPTIFALGLTAIFGNLTQLRGFGTEEYMTFLAAVSFLQAAGFTGAAMGVNLARDIEHGWFDRLLVSPASRGALLTGTVLSASVRVLLPIALLMAVGLGFGLLDWPGIDGLLVGVVLTAMLAAAIACWAVTLAFRFRTQSAGPLMQASAFLVILTTTSYAPYELLTGWLQDAARWNPVTLIVEGVRQGFVGDVTWHDTWPALVAVFGMLILLAVIALRTIRRMTED